MEELSNQVFSAIKGVWKHRWLMAILSWLVFMAGTTTVFLLPDTYQASARVYVDTQSILKPLMSSMTSMPNVEQQVLIMNRSLLSRPNVERLIRMADLDIKAKTVKDFEQLVFELTNQIKLGGTGREDIYTITYDHRNPQVAKDVVQSLLTIFVEGSFGDKKQDSQKAVAFIDEQIKAYETKLVTAENALKDFRIKNAEILPREGITYSAKLAQVAEVLEQARLELREAEQTRNALKKQMAGEDTVLLLDQNVAVSTESEVDARLKGLYKNLDSLQLQFTDRHPDIMATRQLIAQLESRKEQETRQQRERPATRPNYNPMMQQLGASLAEAEASVAALTARVSEYASRYAKLKALTKAIPEAETQLAQLNRDYEVNKDNYEKLIGRREAAKLSEELTATGMIKFRIIDPPVVPQKPIGPNRLRLLSFVLALSLAAGIGGAFAMSQIRPTFASLSSLRAATDMPLLGAVTMNWRPADRMRETRNVYLLGLALFGLIVFYAAAVFKAA